MSRLGRFSNFACSLRSVNAGTLRWTDERTDILVSIIIPTHNNQATLSKTISRLRPLNRLWLEVILVDDGSSPSAASCVPKIILSHGRFRLIEQEQHGAGHARNQGLRHAKGHFVVFLDGDDYLHAGQLRKPLELARREAWDLLAFNTRPIQGKPPVSRETFRKALNYYRRSPALNQGPQPGEKLIAELWSKNSYLPNSGLFAVSRSVIYRNKIWFREGKSFTDNDFTFKVYLEASSAFYMSQLHPHRKQMHGHSVTRLTSSADKARDLVDAAKEIELYARKRWGASGMPLFTHSIIGKLAGRAHENS